VDDRDVAHLRRCIALAAEARAAGDQPFGALLVDGHGCVVAEERNRVVSDRDVTAHPELALARWASAHLDPVARGAATVYTSCEHCAMCATATYWAGVGRIVFALSGAQLRDMLPDSVIKLDLDTRDVLARGNRELVVVEGPCAELDAEARAVFVGVVFEP